MRYPITDRFSQKTFRNSKTQIASLVQPAMRRWRTKKDNLEPFKVPHIVPTVLKALAPSPFRYLQISSDTARNILNNPCFPGTEAESRTVRKNFRARIRTIYQLPEGTKMVRRIPNDAGSGLKKSKRVIVVHENAATRKYALHSSSELAALCSTSDEAEVCWYSFDSLNDYTAASAAAAQAAAANMVVFAVNSADDLPGTIKGWIESWVAKRAESEGVIVGLITSPSALGEIACLKEIYLRHTAHRAGMDYLSQVPPALPQSMPDSRDTYTKRASQVTSVLDEILRANWPPPTLPR